MCVLTLVNPRLNAGFLLGVCHGHDGFLASTFPLQCDSWPITVPTAAWEVMSIAMLLHGFRASRILTLHPTFGPLLLSISYMAIDMVRWVVVVIFPILGFAGAFKYSGGIELTPSGGHRSCSCRTLCEFTSDRAVQDALW